MRMAATSQATLVSASYACKFAFKTTQWKSGKTRICPTRFIVRATSDESDCNSEECAPDKEVGKVSMEWVAEDRTRVVGTFPPRTRSWTGYVEKDTAGQTNIYSVEPPVYIAESAISSGSSGSSADGSENTAGLVAVLAFIAIAAASSILIQVGKAPSTAPVQTTIYSGPPLTYYINKFQPPEIVQPLESSSVEAPEIVQPESASPPEPEIVQPTNAIESSIDAPEVQPESASTPESETPIEVSTAQLDSPPA